MKSGIIVAVAVVVLLAVVGGYFYFNQASSMSDEEGCIKVVGGVVGISNECNDLSECDFYKNLGDKVEEEQCYFGVATNNKNESVCNLISSESMKNGCLQNIAQQNETNFTDEGNDIAYIIFIEGFAFDDPTLTINVGSSVTWENQDSAQHTVTSDSGTELDSEYLSKGETYTHVFMTPGTYTYHCKPHPYMKGTVIVK